MKPDNATTAPVSREDAALARHREALRTRFPLPEPTPRKPGKTKSIAALTLLLGAALTSAGLLAIDPAWRTERYSTAIGEQKMLNLADGSRLTLDSDTQVIVAWHLRSRRADVQRGQALFDVSRTIVRPFLVNAGLTQTQVLGTLFSVRNSDERVWVTLVRGKVSVTSLLGSHPQQTLVPGQQVQALAGQLQPVARVDAEAATAWKDHQLVFNRTSLTDALTDIQRYRAPPIRLDDPVLGAMPISGVFDSRRVEDLIALLPSILPLTLVRDSDGTVHLQRKAAKK